MSVVSASGISQQLLVRSSFVRQERIVIHWFRNTDLRLLDNDALSHSSQLARGDESSRRCKVIPIYCFDTTRIFGNQNTVITSSSSSTRQLKCSPRRAQFLIESVLDLRKQLQETYRSQLLIGVGNPADIFDQVLSQLYNGNDMNSQSPQKSSAYGNYLNKDMIYELHTEIVCQDEPATEERRQVRDVSEILTKYNPLQNIKRVQRIWGSTLYMPYKMPYDPSFRNVGNKSQGFINRMVQLHKLREVLPIPKYLPFLKRLAEPIVSSAPSSSSSSSSVLSNCIADMITYVPTLHDLGYTGDIQLPSPPRTVTTIATTPNLLEDVAVDDKSENILERTAALVLPTSFSSIDATSDMITAHEPTVQDYPSKLAAPAAGITTSDIVVERACNVEAAASSEATVMTTTMTKINTDDNIDIEDDPRSQIRGMKGGETAGLAHVQNYIWETDTLKDWSTMRHAPILQNQSSKFSLYLAHGCISSRYIAHEARKYLNATKAKYAYTIAQNDLVLRDFCKYYAQKHGQRIFRKRYGPVEQRWGDDRYIVPSKCPKQFNAWINGLTGYPLIDACMRELKATGYIKDRCRLLSASFLCNDLHYEWTYGANYFESVCIDYNVFCNWVNWATVAGLTHGHSYDKLRYKHEYKLYDPNGDYIKLWVQELQHLPKEFVTEPWRITSDDETKYNFQYGTDYPYRIVLPRVKAIPHRNEDDVILIREMINRKISVKGIKELKPFLYSYEEKKKMQPPEQILHDDQEKYSHDRGNYNNVHNSNNKGIRY